LKPHDLRRHAAIYASRSGTPIEIVSKILYVIPACQSLRFIWERSAMQRR
jgi:hypothetical protein